MRIRYISLKILILTGFILYILIELNCASRGRPGGGPEDKTPPLIIGTEPRPDTTGLKLLDKIEIYFSERMNETSVENSIFISPPLEYEADWSGGDELTLFLKDSLDYDQTYVITIGSGSMDMQKNRMADSYQFAFSTGNKLNRGEIYGRVFEISEKDIFYVYGYKIIDPDSLNPTIVKADFLSQPGPDGQFYLKYLPDGEYRIFVIEDQNKNLLLDLALERIGIPIKDVTVDSSTSPVGPLNFRVTRIDTTQPELTGARAVDNRTVVLRISEIVKMLTADGISIQDTLNEETLPILDLTRNKEEPKQFYLYTTNQDSGKGYRIFIPEIEDTSGNIQDQIQIADFSGSEIIDTTRFELKRIEPTDSIPNAKLTSKIVLTFTLPVDTSGISKGFICLDKDSNMVDGEWAWKNLSIGSFIQDEGFKPDQVYNFSVASDSIKSLWGDTLVDSTYNRIFFTVSQDEFGFVSGFYRPEVPEDVAIHINLVSIDRGKTTYRSLIRGQTDFQFERVLEGRYKLSGFLDLDDNGKFSAGSLYPFTYAEPYFIGNDTVRVRKRWEISDINFNIPGLE
jgi:hypothetical protein